MRVKKDTEDMNFQFFKLQTAMSKNSRRPTKSPVLGSSGTSSEEEEEEEGGDTLSTRDLGSLESKASIELKEEEENKEGGVEEEDEEEEDSFTESESVGRS